MDASQLISQISNLLQTSQQQQQAGTPQHGASSSRSRSPARSKSPVNVHLIPTQVPSTPITPKQSAYGAQALAAARRVAASSSSLAPFASPIPVTPQSSAPAVPASPLLANLPPQGIDSLIADILAGKPKAVSTPAAPSAASASSAVKSNGNLALPSPSPFAAALANAVSYASAGTSSVPKPWNPPSSQQLPSAAASSAAASAMPSSVAAASSPSMQAPHSPFPFAITAAAASASPDARKLIASLEVRLKKQKEKAEKEAAKRAAMERAQKEIERERSEMRKEYVQTMEVLEREIQKVMSMVEPVALENSNLRDELTDTTRALRAAFLVENSFSKLMAMKCFSAWRTWTLQRVHKSNMAKVHVMSANHRTLYFAFRKWKNGIVRDKRQRIILSLRERVSVRNLRTAFTEWKTQTADWKRISRVMDGLKKRILARSLSESFAEWKEFATERKRQNIGLFSLVERVKSHQLKETFEAWKTFTSHNQQLRTNMADLLRSHCSTALVKQAFVEWHAFMAQRRANLQYMASLMSTFCSHSLTKDAIHRWHLYAYQRKSARILQSRHTNQWFRDVFFAFRAAVRDDITSKRRFLSVLTRGYDHSTIRLTFSTWKSFSRRQRHQRESIPKLADKMCTRTLRTSFTEWKAWKETTKSINRRVSELKLKMGARSSRTTFTEWRQFVSSQQEKREQWAHMLRGNFSVSLVRFTFEQLALNRQLAKERLAAVELKFAAARLRYAKELFDDWKQSAQESIAKRKYFAEIMSLNMGIGQVRRTFLQWRDHTRDNKWMQSQVSSLRAALQDRSLHSAFDEWKQLVQSERKIKNRMSELMAKFGTRSLRSCFMEWKSMASEKSVLRKKSVQFLHLLCGRSLRSCFLSWKAYASQTAALRKKSLKFMELLSGRSLRFSFASWKQYASETAALRKKSVQLLQILSNRSLRFCFESWKVYTTQSVVLRKKSIKFLELLSGRSLRSTFDSWKTYTSQNRSLRQTSLKILQVLSGRSVRTCFDSWKQFTTESAVLRKTSLKLLEILAGRSLRSSFDSWKQYTSESAILRKKSLKLLEIMAGRSLKSSFDSWKEYAAQHSILRKKSLSIISLLSGRTLRSSFMGWKSLASKNALLRRKSRHFLQLLGSRSLSLLFARWRGYVSQQKHAKQTVSTLLSSHFTTAHLRASFDRWMMLIDRARHLDDVADEIRVRIAQRNVAQVFQSWSSYTRHVRSIRHNMSDIFAQCFEGAYLRLTFHRWVESTQATKQQKENVARLKQRVTNHSLLSIFRQFKVCCDVTRAQRRAAERLKWRVCERSTREVFYEWRQHVLTQKRMQTKLVHLIRVLQGRNLSNCFQEWREFVSASKQIKNRFTLTLQRQFMRVAPLRSCFAALQQFVQISRSQHAKALVLAHSQQQKRLQRLINKWTSFVHYNRQIKANLSSTLSSCFSAAILRSAFIRWDAFTDQSIDTKLALDRLRAKISLRSAADWFQEWKQFTQRQQQRKLGIESLRRRMGTRSLLTIVKDWQQYAQTRSQTRKRGAALAQRLFTRNLSRCFNEWKQFSCNQRTQRRKFCTLLMDTFAVADLRCRFSRWRSLLTLARHNESIVDALRKRISSRSIADSFSQWLSFVAYQRALKKHVSSLLASHFAFASLRLCFGRWKQETARQIYRTGCVQVLKTKLATRTLSSVLRDWSAFVALQQSQRKSVDRLRSKLTTRNLSTTFGEWKRVTLAQVNVQKRLLSLKKRISTRSLCTSFAEWKQFTLNRVSSRRRLSSLLSSSFARASLRLYMTKWQQFISTQRVMIESFHTLRSFTQEQAATRHKFALLIVSHLELGVARLCFHALLENVRTAQKQESSALQLRTRISAHSLHSCFNDWKQWNDERQATKQRFASLFASHLSTGYARHLWLRWRSWVQLQQSQRNSVASLRQKLAGRSVASCFASWKQHVAREKRAQCIGKRFLFLMHASALQFAFDEWKSFAQQERGRKSVVARLRHRMQSRGLSQSMNEWKQFVENRRNLRSRFAFIFHGHCSTALVRFCFDSLRQNVIEASARERAVWNLKQRLAARGLTSFFEQWREFVSNQRQLKESVSAVLRAQFSSASLRHYFNHWVWITRDGKAVEETLDRLRTTFGARNVKNMFMTWKSNVAFSKDQKNRMVLLGQKMAGRNLKNTFVQWKKWTLDTQQLRMAVERLRTSLGARSVSTLFAQWKLFVVFNRKMKHIRAVITDRSIRSSFDEWKSFVAHQTTVKNNFAQLLRGNFQSALIRMAFEALKQNVRETQSGEAAAQNLRLALQSRSLCSCFHQWRQFVAENCQLKKRVALLLSGCMSESLVRLYFNRLREAAQDSKYKQHAVDSLRSKLASHSLVSSFNVWRSFVASQSKRRISVQNLRTRLQSQSLKQVWREFSAAVKRERSLRLKLANIRQLLFGSTLQDRFTQWNEYAKHEKRCRSTALKLQHNNQRRLLRLVLVSWHSYATEAADMMRRATGLRIKYGQMATADCFSVWKRYISFKKETRERMSILLRSQFSTSMLRTCFQALKAAMESTRDREAVVIRLRQGLQTRGVASCFAEWKSYIAHVKQVKTSFCSVLASNMSSVHLHILFNHWRSEAKQAVYIKQRVLSIWQRHEMQTVSDCFQALKWNLTDSKRKQTVVASLKNRMASRGLRQAFDEWMFFATERKRKWNKVRSMWATLVRNSLAGCFSAWKNQFVVHRKQSRVRLYTLLKSHFDTNLVRICFDALKTSHVTIKAARVSAEGMGQDMRKKHLLLEPFKAWKHALPRVHATEKQCMQSAFLALKQATLVSPEKHRMAAVLGRRVHRRFLQLVYAHWRVEYMQQVRNERQETRRICSVASRDSVLAALSTLRGVLSLSIKRDITVSQAAYERLAAQELDMTARLHRFLTQLKLRHSDVVDFHQLDMEQYTAAIQSVSTLLRSSIDSISSSAAAFADTQAASQVILSLTNQNHNFAASPSPSPSSPAPIPSSSSSSFTPTPTLSNSANNNVHNATIPSATQVATMVRSGVWNGQFASQLVNLWSVASKCMDVMEDVKSLQSRELMMLSHLLMIPTTRASVDGQEEQQQQSQPEAEQPQKDIKKMTREYIHSAFNQDLDRFEALLAEFQSTVRHRVIKSREDVAVRTQFLHDCLELVDSCCAQLSLDKHPDQAWESAESVAAAEEQSDDDEESEQEDQHNSSTVIPTSPPRTSASFSSSPQAEQEEDLILPPQPAAAAQEQPKPLMNKSEQMEALLQRVDENTQQIAQASSKILRWSSSLGLSLNEPDDDDSATGDEEDDSISISSVESCSPSSLSPSSPYQHHKHGKQQQQVNVDLMVNDDEVEQNEENDDDEENQGSQLQRVRMSRAQRAASASSASASFLSSSSSLPGTPTFTSRGKSNCNGSIHRHNNNNNLSISDLRSFGGAAVSGTPTSPSSNYSMSASFFSAASGDNLNDSLSFHAGGGAAQDALSDLQETFAYEKRVLIDRLLAEEQNSIRYKEALTKVGQEMFSMESELRKQLAQAKKVAAFYEAQVKSMNHPRSNWGTSLSPTRSSSSSASSSASMLVSSPPIASSPSLPYSSSSLLSSSSSSSASLLPSSSSSSAVSTFSQFSRAGSSSLNKPPASYANLHTIRRTSSVSSASEQQQQQQRK